MRRLLLLLPAVAASALLIASCGSGTGGGSAYAPATAAPSGNVSQGSGTTPSAVGVTTTALGTFLVDSQGKTLYLFGADKAGASSCSGGCATAWPPLTTTGTPTARSGVSAAHLATIARPDGTTQVTYYGHPLYYFVKDTAAGDAKGQGIVAYGAAWHVVAADGSGIGG